MCDIMDKYLKKAKNEERKNAICKLIRKGFDKNTILDLDYTEYEYEEAEKSMLCKAKKG